MTYSSTYPRPYTGEQPIEGWRIDKRLSVSNLIWACTLLVGIVVTWTTLDASDTALRVLTKQNAVAISALQEQITQQGKLSERVAVIETQITFVAKGVDRIEKTLERLTPRSAKADSLKTDWATKSMKQ